MHKCGLCCHAVSVCLSVTSVSCVEMSKRIIRLFSPLGSPTILVFPHQTGWRYPDSNPPNGGVEYRWGRQKSRFCAYIWLQCLLLMLRQAGVVNTAGGGPWPPSRKLGHLYRSSYTVNIRPPSAISHCRHGSTVWTVQARSRTIHHGRPRIACMTARLDVTPKTTEQNQMT